MADKPWDYEFTPWTIDGNTRVVSAESKWLEPVMWDRESWDAQLVHEVYRWMNTTIPKPDRPRVFCGSMCDVFEAWDGLMVNERGNTLSATDSLIDPMYAALDLESAHQYGPIRMDVIRWRLFRLILATPNLDWLILTKRPHNVAAIVAAAKHVWQHDGLPNNVWLGVSVENQATADERVSHLLNIPAAVRFLSIELLGPVDLCRVHYEGITEINSLNGDHGVYRPLQGRSDKKVNWVIVGGESGPKARPCRPEWIRSIVKQCQANDVPVFVKQMGENIVTRNDMIEDVWNDGKSGWTEPDVEHNIHGFREDYQGADCRIRLRDPKGGDPNEWPEDMRVRELPKVRI